MILKPISSGVGTTSMDLMNKIASAASAIIGICVLAIGDEEMIELALLPKSHSSSMKYVVHAIRKRPPLINRHLKNSCASGSELSRMRAATWCMYPTDEQCSKRAQSRDGLVAARCSSSSESSSIGSKVGRKTRCCLQTHRSALIQTESCDPPARRSLQAF